MTGVPDKSLVSGLGRAEFLVEDMVYEIWNRYYGGETVISGEKRKDYKVMASIVDCIFLDSPPYQCTPRQGLRASKWYKSRVVR